MLMAGKEELCALSEEDLLDAFIVNSLRNSSRLLFESLRQIIRQQPELRRINLSRKRKKGGSQSQAETRLDTEQIELAKGTVRISVQY